MKLFWPLYSVSFVVATAGVYLLAPQARPYVAGLVKPHVETPPPPAPIMQLSGVTVSQQPKPTAAATAPGSEERDLPPAAQGISLASSGSTPMWGITCLRTTYYKPDGTRQGHVPSGTLFTYRNTHSSSRGEVVECQFLVEGVAPTPFLVGKQDVCLFTGSHTNLTAHQLAALKSYYDLNGKIALRKSDLLQAAAAKNPFSAACNDANKAYSDHLAKAKALAAQRARATNEERSRIEDQLREMKMTELRLKTESEALQRKFNLWRDQHASEVAKPESDPDILKWTQEMASLRSIVPGLAL